MYFEKSCFENDCPSPDSSGNPFTLLPEALEGNKVKDYFT